MKAIVTIIFVLFIGFTAQAKDAKVAVEIPAAQIELAAKNENSVARLHKFKNSRIKKELAFSTKRNKAKLA